MKWQSWPIRDPLSDVEKSLVTHARGFRYTMQPAHDTLGDNIYNVYRDSELMKVLAIDRGRVCDFTVTHDLIAVATVAPAALHILKNAVGSQVLSLKLPLEPADADSVGNISIGNYGSNLLVVWHGKKDEEGPVFAGVISGRDAFAFAYKPLVYYDDTYGLQRMYIRRPWETVIAVPHMPGQYGTICNFGIGGLQFFSLKPYFIINKLTDFLIDNMLFANYPDPAVSPTRMGYFNGWTMGVSINGNHMSMKYAPDKFVKDADTDWIRLEVDGTPVLPTDTLTLKPAGSDYELKITALHELEDLIIHADLPITIRRTADEPYEAVSEYRLPSLLKNDTLNVKLRPTQCLTPWSLARFIEKMNIKIRAEVYKTM